MLSISCEHPDLEEFIGIKEDLDRITKANISIRITDKFMAAVRLKQPFTLHFTRLETGETIEKTVDAYELFHRICKANWDMAEPGMLFWDRINTWNLLSCDNTFEYAGTNPCAEEPLPAGGSCLLGSLNLSEFVKTNEIGFDFESFRNAVKIAVEALNEVLDEGIPLHPLEEQRKSVRDWRQIGLGIFGLADLLVKLGIEYGSDESIYICDMIGHTMADEAIKTSANLAKKYGTYPKYNSDAILQSAFLTKNALGATLDLVAKYGLRNSQLLTIAPTGSLSSMLGVSGGIEPIFANYYERKTETLHGREEKYKVYTPIVKSYMESNDIKDDKDLPKYFVTSHDIDYTKRIKMQATWQTHIDASISSTVNVRNDFTVEQVEDLYMKAWENGLKGVTIFRDGCNRAGVLTTGNEKKEESNLDTIVPITRSELGSRLDGHTYVKNTACGKIYITINRDENDNLVEVFIDSGKSGGCSANAEALGRYASACLRAGMKVDSVVDIAKGVKCSACTKVKGKGDRPIDGLSCSDIIARVIDEEYKELKGISSNKKPKKQKVKVESNNEQTNSKHTCPECNSELVHDGGCKRCPECGWTKCE